MLATKSNSYTFQKSGVWYFSRRVPADLRRHYRTGGITYSLRTKSIRDARVRAMSDAAKLDRHCHILRISSNDFPGKHLLADAVQEPPVEISINEHSLKAAVAVYLRLKGNHRPPTFEADLTKLQAHQTHHLRMAHTFSTLVNCPYKLSAELAVGRPSSQFSYYSVEPDMHLPV